MQHVLRCRERQSDGTEYKKTLRRPELRPDPGELTALPQTPYLVGRGWLPPHQEPHPPDLGPLGLASPTPTPKLVPTPLYPISKWLTLSSAALELALVWSVQL